MIDINKTTKMKMNVCSILPAPLKKTAKSLRKILVEGRA